MQIRWQKIRILMWMEDCWSGLRISQKSIAFSYQKKKKRKRKANSFNYTCCANCFWIKMLIIGQHSWSSPRNYGNEIWKPSWSIGLLLASTAISKASMSSQLWCQQICHPDFHTSVVPPSPLDFLIIESSAISEKRNLFTLTL